STVPAPAHIAEQGALTGMSHPRCLGRRRVPEPAGVTPPVVECLSVGGTAMTQSSSAEEWRAQLAQIRAPARAGTGAAPRGATTPEPQAATRQRPAHTH